MNELEYYVEWRLTGDRYNDSYSNGLTLSGGESVQEMKEISKNADETVFRGRNGEILTVTHKPVGNAVLCNTLIENKTDKEITLELLSSFAVKGINADRMHRAQSFWSAEGKLLSQDLTELDMEQSWAGHGIRIEKFGQTGSLPVRKWFPFLVLEDSANKHFIGVQLYVPSSWQIEVMRVKETVYIQGGLADRDYGAWKKNLAPGESFESPKAVIAEGDSLEEVCDKLVKAQNPRIAEVDKDMPVVFNEYCTTWGNPTPENLEKTAKKLEGTGVRYLVIDSGWYKEQNEDWYAMSGDWNPSKTLFPNGFKEVADMIRSHDLIPGVWFEHETVGFGSKAFQLEDMLLKRDGYTVTVSGRRFLDMRSKKAWDYLDEKVLGLLKECGFGYLKVDYNETIGMGVDGAESVGEGLRQTVLGSAEYFKHLTEELPDLVIENCASGGHRLEPSLMELVSQASFSDAHEAKSIPLIAANLHRLIRPEQCQIWAVLRKDADIHRINYCLTSAFFGRLCLSGEIFDLSDENWLAALDAIKFYDKVKHIIRDGFTKVIRSNVRDYSAPKGYQAVLRELGSEALLIVHTFENGEDPDISDLLKGYTIKDTFGSDLDGDFRGKVYLLG